MSLRLKIVASDVLLSQVVMSMDMSGWTIARSAEICLPLVFLKPSLINNLLSRGSHQEFVLTATISFL